MRRPAADRAARLIAPALGLAVAGCWPRAALSAETLGLPADGTLAVQGPVLGYRIVGEGRPCIVDGSRTFCGNTCSAALARDLRCVRFEGVQVNDTRAAVLEWIRAHEAGR